MTGDVQHIDQFITHTKIYRMGLNGVQWHNRERRVNTKDNMYQKDNLVKIFRCELFRSRFVTFITGHTNT